MFSGRGNPPAASRPPLDKGGLWRGDTSGILKAAFQESTLIRLAFGQPSSPLEAEDLRAARCAAPTEWHGRRVREAAPYGRHGPRRTGGHMGPPLRQKSDRERWFGNARRGGGTAPFEIFSQASPQWGGRDRGKPLRFCAPEIFHPSQGITPVIGVRGKQSYGPRRSEAEP